MLRQVHDLDDAQWKLVTDYLNAGPTKEHIQALKDHLDMANEIKEVEEN